MPLPPAVQAQIDARNAAVKAAVVAMTAGQGERYRREDEAEARKDAARRAREDEVLSRAEARRAYAEQQARLKEHSRPDRIRLATKEQWFDLFTRNGEDEIYEAIAQGHEVASYGRDRGFPLFYFREWCDQHLDRGQVITARRAAAELAAYDSAAMFDDPDSKVSMQAVHHVRARAQHKTWHAERKDAETWGPPKSVAPQQAPVSLVVSIDGGMVPGAHLDRIEAKRAEKLRLAAPFFDPQGDGVVAARVIEHDEE